MEGRLLNQLIQFLFSFHLVWGDKSCRRGDKPCPEERNDVAGRRAARGGGAAGPRTGNWARDAALWFGQRQGRLRLAQLGDLARGMDCAAVGQAVSRFAKRLEEEPSLRRELRRIESRLSKVSI